MALVMAGGLLIKFSHLVCFGATFTSKSSIFELNLRSEPLWSQPGALHAVPRSHDVPQRVESVACAGVAA